MSNRVIHIAVDIKDDRAKTPKKKHAREALDRHMDPDDDYIMNKYAVKYYEQIAETTKSSKSRKAIDPYKLDKNETIGEFIIRINAIAKIK